MNAKKTVSSLGWVLVVLGVAGFIPGVTTDGLLVGLFQVDAVHNMVHLVIGILAVAAASKGGNSAMGLAKVVGVIFALMTLLGFVADGSIIGLFEVNLMDNLLHLVLAVLFLWVGFGKK